MRSELYACVHAAEFPAQALLRLRTDMQTQPVVVLDGPELQETVCSLNRHAVWRGAVMGMTRLEAEGISGLQLLPRSAEVETAARAVLLECAAKFSPRIEEASQGTTCALVLDIAGTELLFGPSEKLAVRLRDEMATAGFRISIAVSANFHAARIKATATRGITIIREGEEECALEKLPIASLDLTEEHKETFALWGIRTLGELGALPEVELIKRLGAAASNWRTLAHGVARHTFQPIEPEFELKEFYDFENPVEEIDSLFFIGARMIDCLVSRAVGRALSLASLTVDMKLEGGQVHHLAIHPAVPSVDRKFLLKLLQLEMGAHPPLAAVVSLTLTAEADQSSNIQLGLFAPQTPEPSRLDVTLARLKAIVGEDRVGAPVLEDTHRPGSFHVEGFVVDAKTASQEAEHPRMALRRVRPPHPIQVSLHAMKLVGMELLFERFLNENRGEWPDIDLDLPSGDQRERVIQYIYERYGAHGAAMTANVISYRGRSAAREVGKALGFEEEQLARLSSLMGHWEWRGENDTLARHFEQAGFDIRHPRIAHYFDLCQRMQDLPRHLGQHSGGMVIYAGMLNRVVPIERASMPGRTVIQWDKEDCADLGLIKVDLLGLGMMAVLKDSIELIPRHYGTQVDLAALPEDPLVYETLSKADTVGMFQVESRAQMASIPHNAPTRFYDLVVQVAIIRPGPIVGKMMHPYMRRRQGREAVTYPHPSLEPVLKRTLGVPLFQEQLLRMAMNIADFSGAEAEELRRAVGMRRSMQRMKDLEGRLRSGMTRNGISAEAQDNIVQSISSFAMYGFPESHAASFALIAYASAYIKVHYLAAFTCGLLNNQPMGFYSPAVLIKDAQRHGLRVRPIDVQRSDGICTLEAEPDGSLTLRIGLNYAKGLRRSSVKSLFEARSIHGPFTSIEDLSLRVPTLNRKELVSLARIGALNALDHVEHRRDALWQVEEAGRPVGPLLRGTDHLADEPREPMPLHSMTTDERLSADYAGTGITTGPHPMAYHRAILRSEGILSAMDLLARPSNQPVRIAGCVIARQRPGTAKGFVFLSLEDETGIANVILTPDVFERDRMVVTRSHFLRIEGTLQNQDGVIHVKAQRIVPLEITSAVMTSHDFH